MYVVGRARRAIKIIPVRWCYGISNGRGLDYVTNVALSSPSCMGKAEPDQITTGCADAYAYVWAQ